MFIKHIDWLDKEAREAAVLLSDGIIVILCFSHPFSGVVGDKLTEPIHCLDAENITVADNHKAYVKRKNSLGYFGYSVCGKFIDRKNQIVLLGNATLSLGNVYIPNDISEGSYITFDVGRLDIWMDTTK